MKNKKFDKKLSLNKETITTLSNTDMHVIVGGDIFVALTPQCPVPSGVLQTNISCPSYCLHTCSC